MRSLFAAQILLAALVLAQDDGTTVDPATTTTTDDGSGDAAGDEATTVTTGGDTATEDAAADAQEQTFSDECVDWILAFRDAIDDQLAFYDSASQTLYADSDISTADVVQDTVGIKGQTFDDGATPYTEPCLDEMTQDYQGVAPEEEVDTTPVDAPDPDGLSNVAAMPNLDLNYTFDDGSETGEQRSYGHIEVKTGWTSGGAGSDIGTEYSMVMKVVPDAGGNFFSLQLPAVSMVFQAEDTAEDAALKTEISTFQLQCARARTTPGFNLCQQRYGNFADDFNSLTTSGFSTQALWSQDEYAAQSRAFYWAEELDFRFVSGNTVPASFFQMSYGTELPDDNSFAKFKLKRTNVGISGIGVGRSPLFMLQFSPNYDAADADGNALNPESAIFLPTSIEFAEDPDADDGSDDGSDTGSGDQTGDGTGDGTDDGTGDDSGDGSGDGTGDDTGDNGSGDNTDGGDGGDVTEGDGDAGNNDNAFYMTVGASMAAVVALAF